MKNITPRIVVFALVLALTSGSALVIHSKLNAQTLTPITSELSVGASGANVTALQTFLATNPQVYPEGMITGYYGPLTEKAVTNFQIGYGLPAVGRFGPQTQQTANALISGARSLDVSGPMISNVSVNIAGHNATISWTTNELARGKVFYSSSPMILADAERSKIEPYVGGTFMSDDALTATKSVTLQNLSANTTYYFMIEAIDASGNTSVWSVPVKTFVIGL